MLPQVWLSTSWVDPAIPAQDISVIWVIRAVGKLTPALV